MTTPLPTPRDLLTSLINTITSAPTTPPNPQPSDNDTHHAPAPSNALAAIHPTRRALVAALHALFPTALLPALDLLDHGLVARLDLQTTTTSTTARSVYHVRSARSRQHPRRAAQAGEDVTGPTYLVRLEAWSCTCAAFALAAFPGPEYVSSDMEAGDEGVEGSYGQDEDAATWEFGGLSLDNDGGTPVCKHLLACMLAERWGRVLGGYVVAKKVSKEEMAGIFADV